jgi:hypothetical protein
MRSRVGSDSARNDFKVEDMIFKAPSFFEKAFDALLGCYIILS